MRAQRGGQLAGAVVFLATGLWLMVPILLKAPAIPAPAEHHEMLPLARSAEAFSPQAILPLSVPDARAANAAIPLGTVPLTPGRPLNLLSYSSGTSQALDCLTSAIHYEAASEPADGKRAVAQVVLNRVRHPAFPATVCGVIYQGAERRTGCQFSFTCDGSLRRKPRPSAWQVARVIAIEALSGRVFAPVGLATHYHADYVLPYWAPTLTKNLVLGHHIFYQWSGNLGRPAAFAQHYAGGEPQVSGSPALDDAGSLAAALPIAPIQPRTILSLDGAPLDTSLPRQSAAAPRGPAHTAVTARYVITLDAPSSVKVSMVAP